MTNNNPPNSHEEIPENWDNKTIIKNIQKTGREAAKSSLERFIANFLYGIGINHLLGYNTRRFHGVGDFFDADGNFKGKGDVCISGFEKRPNIRIKKQPLTKNN